MSEYDKMQTIGHKMRDVRVAMKLTQPAICRLSGFSSGSVAMWELAQRTPTLSALAVWCDALHITVEDFFQSLGGDTGAKRAGCDVMSLLRRWLINRLMPRVCYATCDIVGGKTRVVAVYLTVEEATANARMIPEYLSYVVLPVIFEGGKWEFSHFSQVTGGRRVG